MPFPSDAEKAAKITAKKYAEELLGELTKKEGQVQKAYLIPAFKFSDGEAPLLYVGALDPKWKPAFPPKDSVAGNCIFAGGKLKIDWKKNPTLFKSAQEKGLKESVKAVKGLEFEYGVVEAASDKDDDAASSSDAPASSIDDPSKLSPAGKKAYDEFVALLEKVEKLPPADKVTDPKLQEQVKAAFKRLDELQGIIEKELA